MGFSRQEYWSGFPLPSPLAYTSARVSAKNGKKTTNQPTGNSYLVGETRCGKSALDISNVTVIFLFLNLGAYVGFVMLLFLVHLINVLVTALYMIKH